MRSLCLSVMLAVTLCAGTAAGQISTSPQTAVESALLPAVVIDGERKGWTIAERMTRWGVPGVSIAVIDRDGTVWARGYGVIAADRPGPVTTETRFQAASISKLVTAAAAMALVEEGKLALDRDVNADLRSWRLPVSAFTADRPLTLRDLLSHTGGTTVSGFPGYAPSGATPNLRQILDGGSPANTAPVISEALPGLRWKYSGGGYQIVQQQIEDVTGRPFADFVRDRVLTPAGMTASGYSTPTTGAFAFGHGLGGKPIDGGWRNYPEQAAAGLWTTPTDLARFALALAASFRGEKNGPLSQETVRTMLTPVMGDYGLGPGVSGADAALAISHGGANAGFRAFWVVHPQSGTGVVVMTNGDGGDRLMMEIVRGVAAIYGWPDYQPIAQASVALAPGVLDAREGVWSTEWQGDRVEFTVSRDGGRLSIATFRGTFLFTPTSPSAMIATETGATVTFDSDTTGTPTLTAFGLRLTKQVPVAAAPK